MRFSSQTWAFWFSVKTVCSCSVCPVDEDKNSALNSCCPWINDKRDWIFKYLFFPVSLEAGRVTPTTPPPLSAVTKFHSSERRLVSRSTLCKNEDLSDVSGADVTCGEDNALFLCWGDRVRGSPQVQLQALKVSFTFHNRLSSSGTTQILHWHDVSFLFHGLRNNRSSWQTSKTIHTPLINCPCSL